MPTKKGLLTTGDMARLTGNTLRTVRFYEEEGLLQPVRSQGGHRLFEAEQLHKLRLISDLRNIGLALPVIKEVFRIKEECRTATDASHQVKEFLQAQIKRMQEQIELLQRLRDEFQAAMKVFSECEQCKEDWMHRRCEACEVMACETLPAHVRIMWLDHPPGERSLVPPGSDAPARS
jgi:MerR family Zn(II)-responsive transcriptional regulator of zntA